MRYHGVKGNLAGGHEDVIETEDKFDVLVDANDQLLERVVSAVTTVGTRGGTIPEITTRYVSRYLSHDTIRITIHR